MYTIAIQRDFIAAHFLVGGDWGSENLPHSHHYRVQVRLEGDGLDTHGYLVDIVDVETHIDGLVASYRDRTLNDLPVFEGLNPSIEHFARILCSAFCRDAAGVLTAGKIREVEIRIWENDIAWTAYRRPV